MPEHRSSRVERRFETTSCTRRDGANEGQQHDLSVHVSLFRPRCPPPVLKYVTLVQNMKLGMGKSAMQVRSCTRPRQ